MVADYNSRCGAFKYRSGALESARSDIELFRFELAAEGRSYFSGKPTTASVSPSPTIILDPEPPAVVPEQKVSSVANPQLSGPERESIEAACSTDKYVNGPSAYNNCLSSQLHALERQGSRPNLSGLSASARQSIEAACSTDKYVNGPAAYNACLSSQLAQLRN